MPGLCSEGMLTVDSRLCIKPAVEKLEWSNSSLNCLWLFFQMQAGRLTAVLVKCFEIYR